MAYALLVAARHEPTPLEHALLEELERSTPIAVTERYDHIYIPPRIALLADDVRPGGEDFQRSTDGEIVSALEQWQIPHAVLDVTVHEDVEAEIERLASTSRHS